jgi:hypothetical protein
MWWDMMRWAVAGCGVGRRWSHLLQVQLLLPADVPVVELQGRRSAWSHMLAISLYVNLHRNRYRSYKLNYNDRKGKLLFLY